MPSFGNVILNVVKNLVAILVSTPCPPAERTLLHLFFYCGSKMLRPSICLI